jgi:hypothetical protein
MRFTGSGFRLELRGICFGASARDLVCAPCRVFVFHLPPAPAPTSPLPLLLEPICGQTSDAPDDCTADHGHKFIIPFAAIFS